MDVAVQPRNLLTVNQFLALLDQSNRSAHWVQATLCQCRDSIIRIYKKDSALCDIIMGNHSYTCLPIIDKPLQVVIEARDSHEEITGALYCYHQRTEGKDPEVWDSRIWGELYHKFGYGYYFSGAFSNRRTIVLTDYAYRPDPFDKDLFISLGIK
jgi:hypothetical protein